MQNAIFDYNFDNIAGVSQPVLVRYGVTKAGIFGSYSTGENTPSSDIDFLVELPRGTTLFDLASLKIDLEKVLSKEVDVVTYKSIKPQLKESILGSEKRII